MSDSSRLLVLIALNLSVVLAKQVHLVNLVYRHGDRSPTETYPNSEYQEDTWPQGFGELSQNGIKMQYHLGQYLNQRYKVDNKLLSERYSRYEINVRSTDVNRTLMSAQSNMAGLYKPTGKQIWNEDLLWQPIPIHTVPVPDDYVLRTNGPPCPKYDKLHQQTLDSDPEYLKLNKQYADFLARISKSAGYNTSLDINSIWQLHDPLFIEKFNNLTLPDWYTDEDMATLKTLSDWGMYFLFNTKEKAKLRAGNLVGHMVGNMKASMATDVDENKRRKMWMYSAHDTTLTAFMQALDVFNKEQPPLASCVGLDLIEDNNKYFVEIWYHNDTKLGSPPFNLTLPGCSFTCPLDDFVKLTQDVIPKDILKECGVHKDKPSKLSLYILIGIAMVLCIAIMVLLVCAMLCRNLKRGGEPQHMRLPTEDVNA